MYIVTGADPTIEDNDHNRPVDLVSDDDTVSRNCLKNAMMNRERYMGGIADMRARGISSSTQSFQKIISNSNSSLAMEEGMPRMSRSYSFQGISPLTPNSQIMAGASIYDEGLYLQPVGSRSTLTRSESGTTLTGSLTLSRQNSQESLHSNSSSLYAHILDSSYEKRRNNNGAKNQKESGSPHKVVHKRKSREFKRGGPPPPDSDSSVCDENWERRSLPPGRRSMSVDATGRVKFASLRKPSKHKGKDQKSKELIFVRSPFAKKLPSEADSVSLCSEVPSQPIAASSPYKGGSVPSSPMVPKNMRFQRSTSLDESEINAVRNHLRHVPKSHSANSKGVALKNDTKANESDSSSLWQVTPNSSLSNALPSPTENPHIQQNFMTSSVVRNGVQSSMPNTLEVKQEELNDSGDAIYENIPADADDEDHVYGNVPSPARERAAVMPKPQPSVSSPRKPPILKPFVSPRPIQRKKSDASQPKSPDVTIKVSPNQTIRISSNPASPQEVREKVENERLPESLKLKLGVNESDSDDTFFDDASFDTISDSSHGNRIKSPPTVREQRGSIAEQLKKVVSDPKLKEWLAEQATRAKQRQEAVGTKDDDRVDFGKETESDTIKKNPAVKIKRTDSLGKGPKPAPNPKPRNLSLRGKIKNENKPPVVRPTEAPPLPPEEDTDDSFDDASFDTLEDSEDDGQQAAANNAHNDSVQYETMNNLNNPGKPVPVPRKTSIPSRSRSNTEESRGSQELLNWERFDPRDNDSYYWEHTGTEEFLKAKNKNSPPQGLQPPPVHKLLPEAEYIQMHGLVKTQQQQQNLNDRVTQSPPNARPLSTFKSPPTSPTIPKSAKITFSDQTDDNQNVITTTSPSGGSTKGNIFVSIPGEGNFTDALSKPIGRQVSDEYEFHKQQLDLNASSPVNIEHKIEKRLSQEDLVEMDHSPKNLGIPIINLEHSPNSKAQSRSDYLNEESRMNHQRHSQSSESSTSITHIPGPKNADQMYAVVNKSVKRTPSNTSEVSSVSTSQRASAEANSPKSEGELNRTPSFSTAPVETSSDVGQQSKDLGKLPQYMTSREGIYEELPSDESPKRRVTIGTEQIIFPDDPERKAKDHDHRVIRYNSRGKTRISIVGGNADGIYVHRIDPGSDAEQQGLMEGDQILRINNQSINGMTKEEVTLMLLSLPNIVTLTVRYKRDRYDAIAANAGMGDSFYVKANFSYEPTTQGEIRIHEGDVMSVRDTLPDGQVGSWRALKVNARPNETQHGLIPNEGRAEQVALAQRQMQTSRGRSLEREPKPGFLRRSFRRSKSAERLNKETDAFHRDQAARFESIKKPAYDRVEQRPPGFLRPVAIVGLFCDTVRDRLSNDCPGLFERAPPEVEIPCSKEEGDKDKDPVNLKLIHSIMDRRKHCLMIVSPRAIQFLQQTQLHPIVIYLHPGSKMVIKALRTQLAPRFDKRSSFMYEEAVQFERTYAHLFTATVTYTTDDSWFTLLKDTISRIQNQPLWQLAPKVVPSSAETSPEPVHQQKMQQNSKPLPRGRAITRQIPNAIQNVMNRHAGGNSAKLNGIDLDSSMTSVDSVDSSARYRKPMTLTYDGYFLSGPGNEDLQSSSSSQSLSGPMNGQAKIVEISDNQGRPKGILKKRPSGGSIHSTGAPSDYESDISFSGDPMMSRRSPGMVNGYPPRNEVTVLQMEPKRTQQQQHPSVVMKQPKFMGNGMTPQMAANSPAMHSRQQQIQQHKWGKQPQLQQQPHARQFNHHQQQEQQQAQMAAGRSQVSTLQCFRFRIDKNWPTLMRTVLGDLLSDHEIIEALIGDLKRKPLEELEKCITDLIELWINFRWPSFTDGGAPPNR